MKQAIIELTHSDATHVLSCKHCIGKHCMNYYMKCIVIAECKSSVKILVFGERNWKNKEHVKRVRYVNRNKISKIAPHEAQSKNN
jgi:hypothetical protein